MKELFYPLDSNYILKNKKKIKRELLENDNKFKEVKIAILGGSTTSDIAQILELFLLNNGIKPIFYESEYNKFFEDAVFENKKLDEFNPDLIYIYTTNRNILVYPSVKMSDQDIVNLIETEYKKYKLIWDKLIEKYNVPIIQNNFELPLYRIMGNADCYKTYGNVNYINQLNLKFAEYANNHNNFYINDINYISSCYGLDKWYNQKLWYMYKYAIDLLAIPNLTYSVSNIIKSIYGKNKKSIILDMDNTIWGGVIGDDGIEGIIIGNDTAKGQAYLDFQKYLKLHKDYGIILNVCSKNDYDNAILGLNHPDTILTKDDFVEIKANWSPKNENILNIASEISLGVDSFVFIDDNPMERDIVRSNLKNIAVPDINDVDDYISVMDKNRYFKILSISNEDIKKTEMYKANIQRTEMLNNSLDYNEYLKSLEMVTTIKDFEAIYLDRITQLANKSNQFNLTTKRYTINEIENIFKSKDYIKLYAKLEDKFGDNGLVSIVIGKIEKNILHIDLWVMSCRVLKRTLEDAIMNKLVDKCRKLNINKIKGYYYKTEKNKMVEKFYESFGFKLISKNNEDTIWQLDINDYKSKEIYMKIIDK